MLARFRASSPDRCPQAAKSPFHASGTTEGVVRKATAFRGGANKTAPSCETGAENGHFATVPVERLQRNITLQQIVLLGKPIFSVRQKGVPPLLLPASMLQLPRCLTRICNLFQKEQLIANWQVSKSAIAAGKTDYKIQFAPQMWATRPHLGSIFEKLLHRKTFYFACGSYLATIPL